MREGYLFLLLLTLVQIVCRLQSATARHAWRPAGPGACARCAPGFGVARHCSRRRDTECRACAPGHYSAHHSARRPCYPCSRCGAGLYVAHACTPAADTVCDSCHTYKGPHNEDFFARCVRPLFEAHGGNATAHAAITKESVPPEVPLLVIVLSCSAIVVLATALITTCCVVSTRWRCKRVDHHYEAVSTQEVML